MENEILNQILNELKELKQGQVEIKKDLNSVVEQTAELIEFRTTTSAKLDDIANKINSIEAVTKENLYDIAKLKLAKQFT